MSTMPEPLAPLLFADLALHDLHAAEGGPPGDADQRRVAVLEAFGLVLESAEYPHTFDEDPHRRMHDRVR